MKRGGEIYGILSMLPKLQNIVLNHSMAKNTLTEMLQLILGAAVFHAVSF
jgi:hypothetical protein